MLTTGSDICLRVWTNPSCIVTSKNGWAAVMSTHARGVVGWLLSAMVAAAACSDSPVRPTPDPGAPSLSCPAPLTVSAPENAPVAVTYAKPDVSGGAQPVSTVCTPDTATTFALGSTTVTCRSTDARGRIATCAFSVTVQPARVLQASRILAFGDSITEGKTAAGLLDLPAVAVGCPIPDRATSYPRVLGELLRARFPTQPIEAINCGVGGETASDGAVRLPSALSLTGPDVVLVLHGANDFTAIAQAGGTASTAVAQVSGAISSMIRQARGPRAVFVATLLPQRPGGKAPRPEWVEPVNTRLRTLVPAEGAVLVDLYRALGSAADPYIDTDGLHPTLEGHRRIAEAFAEAIRAHLERAPQ